MIHHDTLLQHVTDITKCDSSFITKYVRLFITKYNSFTTKMRQLLEIATIYYKTRRLLQIATVQMPLIEMTVHFEIN